MEIKNTEVFGLERAVKAIGNSYAVGEIDTLLTLSEKEMELAKKLGSNMEAHQSHDSFLKGIDVYFDIKYSQYWSMEAQRYKFFEILMSSSKMHRLPAMASSLDFPEQFNKYVDREAIERVERYAAEYKKAKTPETKYEYFMKTVSNLPMGYELWMTCKTNYLQLKTMVIQREKHILKEDWGKFCSWCYNLPMFTELTGCGKDGEKS